MENLILTKIKRKQSGTCLAVIREQKGRKKGELIFASDRRISWGMGKHQVGVRSKTVKRNGVIFAGTGSSYLCDVIGELMGVPDIPKTMDGFSYTHHCLYPCIKNILVEKEFKDKDGGVVFPDELSAVILIGVKGELFELCLDADTGITLDAIDAPYAHGCGGDYALGSLKTTEYLKMDSIDRLKTALNIAAQLSPGCDANIDIVRESDEDMG